MTSKMVAKVLSYELGSPSHDNSKLEKLEDQPSSSLVNGKRVFSDAAKNGTTFS